MKCRECEHRVFEKAHGKQKAHRYYCSNEKLDNKSLLCRCENSSTEFNRKLLPKWCPESKPKITFVNEGGEENEIAILGILIEHLCTHSPILNGGSNG